MATITASLLRTALTDHREPPSPTDIILPENSAGLPADWQRMQSENLRVAAILVPFIERATGEIEVLLTERAAHLRHHAGQISFPGGASEPEDTDLAATAIREAREEVGLRAEQIEVIGFLRPQWTISNFAMTPVIALVSEPVTLALQASEVASAFCAPADVLLNPDSHRIERRQVGEATFDTVETVWQSRRIWGATATVLRRISFLLRNN